MEFPDGKWTSGVVFKLFFQLENFLQTKSYSEAQFLKQIEKKLLWLKKMEWEQSIHYPMSSPRLIDDDDR